MKNKTIIELNHDDAKNYFLKHESYCTVDLPKHFTFKKLLEKISFVLTSKKLSDFCKSANEAKKLEKVNYNLFTNKDGEYSWRLLQLIHPVLYVDLVHQITNKSNWEQIQNRFKFFSHESYRISCTSIPIINNNSEKSNKATQIISWKRDTERESIRLALKYKYIFHTDIVDCYGSIYTHSIAWALHGKGVAKNTRSNKELLGNIIDDILQQMSNGQTNGIPQGSTLMDFISEIVLGYSDSLLDIELKEVKDFKIIRYRDDYRVFVNNPEDGKLIIKCLSEVMSKLGMRIHPEKTNFSDDVITSSIKADKMHWISHPKSFKDLQSELLAIRNLANRFPNSGTLVNCLVKFDKKLLNIKNIDYEVLVTIITDIAYKNPNTYNIAVAIISKLLSHIALEERKIIIIEIINKFKNIPNTEILHLWLQRIVISDEFNEYSSDIQFTGSLCDYVNSRLSKRIWNSDWLQENKLKKVIENESIIGEFPSSAIISNSEINIFTDYNN